MEKRIAPLLRRCLLPRYARILKERRCAMEKRIAPLLRRCLLPRYARILKSGTYGSP